MKLSNFLKQRAVVCAVGGALTLTACSASSGASTRTKDAPVPLSPAACLHALDLAEVLLAESTEAVHIDSQIFAGTASVANSAPRLTELTTSQAAIKPNYVRAKAACRASR